MKQEKGAGSPTRWELPFVIGKWTQACCVKGTRANDVSLEHVLKKTSQGRRWGESPETRAVLAQVPAQTLGPHRAAQALVWQCGLHGTHKARFLPPETHRGAELAGHARDKHGLRH